MQNLQKEEVRIGMLVTDRHKSIAKWIRTNLPNTDHRYDIWHMAKGTYYPLLPRNYYYKITTYDIANFDVALDVMLCRIYGIILLF